MSVVDSKSSKRSRQSSPGAQVDLHLTNPELFKASPRPGGFLKIRVPPRGEHYDYNLDKSPDNNEAEDCICSSDPNICINMPGGANASGNASIMLSRSGHGANEKMPSLPKMLPGREFRLKRAVESTDWTIRGIDETDTMIEISNPIQDTLNMLAVTISTIMMMAAQVPDIENIYLDWATEYLNCIVDEDDEELNRPPNVQGILNHILFLKMGGKSSGNDNNIPNQKSSKGSPPSSLKKGVDNHSGGGSIGGGSAGAGTGPRSPSAGAGGSMASTGSNRPGSGAGSRTAAGSNSHKGVSISESGTRGVGRNSPTTLTAIKGR